MFCSKEFALSNSVIVLFLSIVVSMEMNRRHYFRSGPRTFSEKRTGTPGMTDGHDEGNGHL